MTAAENDGMSATENEVRIIDWTWNEVIGKLCWSSCVGVAVLGIAVLGIAVLAANPS
jgi:hypothetical protein